MRTFWGCLPPVMKIIFPWRLGISDVGVNKTILKVSKWFEVSIVDDENSVFIYWHFNRNQHHADGGFEIPKTRPQYLLENLSISPRVI